MALFNGLNKLKGFVGGTKLKAAYVGGVKVWSAFEATIGAIVLDSKSMNHIVRTKDYGATWEVLYSTSTSLSYMVHGCGGLFFTEGYGTSRKFKFIADNSTVIQNCVIPVTDVPSSLVSTEKHILVTYNDGTYTTSYISSDGINFVYAGSAISAPYYANGYASASVLLNTMYMPSGSTGADTVFTSTNGERWVQIYNCWSHGSGYAAKRFIKFSRLLNRFIIADNTPRIFLGVPNANTFYPGFTWTYISLSQFNADYLSSIAEGTNKVLAFLRGSGNSSYFVIYSSDGVNWTRGATFPFQVSYSFFDGEYFIAQCPGSSGGLFKSADGITWERLPKAVDAVESIYFAGCSEK